MMKNVLTKTSLTALSAAAFVSATQASPVIYEPFAYSNGPINGSQSGATGTTGAWTNSGNVSGNNFQVVSGLSFPGLAGIGTSPDGAVRRPSAPNGAEISVGISSGAQTALLADGTSVYFSLLYRNDRNSVGNDNLTFMIGSGAFTFNDSDRVIPNIAGGEGFGVLATASIDLTNGSNQVGNRTMDVYGYVADNNGVSTTSSISNTFFDTDPTNIAPNNPAVETFMILGRIDWVANGGNDTLTLWNVVDPEAGLPASSFATISADLNQSAFDTLAITDRQVGTFDEIRFGLSLADVGVVPEPGSLALLGLGGLLIGARRRRS